MTHNKAQFLTLWNHRVKVSHRVSCLDRVHPVTNILMDLEFVRYKPSGWLLCICIYHAFRCFAVLYSPWSALRSTSLSRTRTRYTSPWWSSWPVRCRRPNSSQNAWRSRRRSAFYSSPNPTQSSTGTFSIAYLGWSLKISVALRQSALAPMPLPSYSNNKRANAASNITAEPAPKLGSPRLPAVPSQTENCCAGENRRSQTRMEIRLWFKVSD